MKKTFAVLLAMLMLVLTAVPVFAADGVVLAYGDPIYNEDGTVSVPLELRNNPGFYYLAVTLDLDVEVLSYSVENNSELGFAQGEGDMAVNLIWYANGLDNYVGDGTLAVITITPYGDAPHADFDLDIVAEWIECYDIDEADVAVEVIPGSFTLEHEVVHVDAVAPACHYDGNIEYWFCSGCQMVWADEALTQVTNFKSVILPATGEGDLVHMEAVEPGCHMDGNIEYWVCYDCEQVWQDEALTQLTNIKNVVLPATGEGNLVHMEAVEPGCHMDGNIEYWICYDCEKVWQDEDLTQLTNIKNVVRPATGGEVVHVEAKAPTATEDGNIEYWYCKDCELVWQDKELTQLTNFKNVVIPATGVLLGDVDLNGAVNAKDYMMLKRYVLGTFELTDDQLAAADIDGNGEVKSKDYMMLKRMVLGTWTPGTAE